MNDTSRTVPAHECREVGECPVCAVPRWAWTAAPEHQVAAGMSSVVEVRLYGNDMGEIQEAFRHMCNTMGVTCD